MSSGWAELRFGRFGEMVTMWVVIEDFARSECDGLCSLCVPGAIQTSIEESA